MNIVTLHLFPPLFQHPPLVHNVEGQYRRLGRHDRMAFSVGDYPVPIRLPLEEFPGRTGPGRTWTRCGGIAKRTGMGYMRLRVKQEG